MGKKKQDRRVIEQPDSFTNDAFHVYMRNGCIGDFDEIEDTWKFIDPKQMKDKVTCMKGGYDAFLQSEYWKTVANEVKRRSGYKCKICGSEKDLNVHHETYKHKGLEVLHMEDLTCVCKNCHAKLHNKPYTVELKPVYADNSYKPVYVDKSYFDKLSKEELLKKCKELYDTFQVLRDCQIENRYLKEELNKLRKPVYKKVRLYKDFDDPIEDEIRTLF